MPGMISPANLAKRWGVGEGTVTRIVMSRDLPAVVLRGMIRVPLDAVTEFEGLPHFKSLIQETLEDTKLRMRAIPKPRNKRKSKVVKSIKAKGDLPDIGQILDSSFPVKKSAGVYFLIKGEAIIYVGKSINVLSRLSEHFHGKDFDRITIIECAEEDLTRIEQHYIKLLTPPLNDCLVARKHRWLKGEPERFVPL